MKKLTQYLSDHLFNVFIIFLVVLNVLPILAPIFLQWGWNVPAAAIYTLYSFFCHQFHWRSLHVYDHQCAWCTRDMFIWGSLLTVTLIVKMFKVRTIKWYWLIPFMVPIAMDGGVQTIATLLGFSSSNPLYISNNFMRMITGTLFGTGLGLWMMPSLKETFVNEPKPKTQPQAV